MHSGGPCRGMKYGVAEKEICAKLDQLELAIRRASLSFSVLSGQLEEQLADGTRLVPRCAWTKYSKVEVRFSRVYSRFKVDRLTS
jgi:hypothetical protein